MMYYYLSMYTTHHKFYSRTC